ncbi:MAG: hypothetical protein CVU42_17265 [Chloroflexi bacterium HGW-Chloroflexi-4]|nr:MAG: hypothetical protein CVU42_17265 [Chloroflexi bacterium HGW-Chloroflexi-4]
MRKQSVHFTIFFAFIILSIATSCNFPVYFTPRNSSFDEAILLMISSRSNLDLYQNPEGGVTSSVAGEIMMIDTTNNLMGGSKEKLNEQLALTSEFQRLAAAAEEKGNQFMVDFYTAKADEHQIMANQLEKRRADWRRNHRFFYVVKRGARAFGHAIGNILDFAANALISNIRNRIEFYINEIRSFLANPIRYTFDLTLQRQLEIVKNQLTSRLGPFFGQRAYDLLKIDQTAWTIERRLFVRKTQSSKATLIPNQVVSTPPLTETLTTFSGNWHGSDCEETEDDYRYRWSLELFQDPETDQFMGTIRFHACPGGGRVLYRVIGQPTTGRTITLSGIKEDGRGDLYANSPETMVFKFNTKKITVLPNLSN